MNNFWKKLKKPFFVLAPMDGVTDASMRTVLAQTAKPDVLFTEFVNVEGLVSKGGDQVLKRLKFSEVERPVVAQIWGINPDAYFKAAKIVQDLGYDGIDINMGCPVSDVTKTGACSAMINNPVLAKEVIEATKKGAPRLPVSVKTRIGFNKIQTEEWIGYLLTLNLEALTIHGRTAKEMSKVPAHWDEIGKVSDLRSQINPETLIIGNGDVKTLKEGLEKARTYNIDGIMIGRGIFSDFWIFDPEKNEGKVSIDEKLDKLLEHVEVFYQTWGGTRDFNILKKFFKVYANGFAGASNLRVDLMAAKDGEEVQKIITDFRPILANPQINN
jgi:nifR3 family TIM-barrel protein